MAVIHRHSSNEACDPSTCGRIVRTGFQPLTREQADQSNRDRHTDAKVKAEADAVPTLQTFHVMKQVTSVHHIAVQATTAAHARQLADANEGDDLGLVEDWSGPCDTWETFTDAEYKALDREDEEQEPTGWDETNGAPTPAPNLWIAIYHHRHGTDAIPFYQTEPLTPEQVIATLDNWEGEGSEDPREDEYLDICGPFPARG
jgi:hypothetical protein